MRRLTPNIRRPAVRRLRARLTHVFYTFFMRQAPFIIGQIVVLRGQAVRKVQLSDEELHAIEQILAGIDFYGWAVLAGDVDDLIAEAFADGGYEALRLIGLDVTADADVFSVVNEESVKYAAARSAELVGKRRLADGTLIQNPDRSFAITESTRDMLRADVADALTEGWTNAELASRLADNYSFSPDRAMVIARTETIRASNYGTLDGFNASGVVEKKEWSTAEDDRVSEECEENGDQGPIDLGDEFKSGDDAPPAHPNCRCVLVGLTELDTQSDAQTITEEQEA